MSMYWSIYRPTVAYNRWDVNARNGAAAVHMTGSHNTVQQRVFLATQQACHKDANAVDCTWKLAVETMHRIVATSVKRLQALCTATDFLSDTAWKMCYVSTLGKRHECVLTLNLRMERYTQSVYTIRQTSTHTKIQTESCRYAQTEQHDENGNAANGDRHPQRALAQNSVPIDQIHTHVIYTTVNANGLITKLERVNQININDYNGIHWQQ